MTMTSELRNNGFKVDYEWFGLLSLAGLREITNDMGKETTNAKNSTDLIKTKLERQWEEKEPVFSAYNFADNNDRHRHPTAHVKACGLDECPKCPSDAKMKVIDNDRATMQEMGNVNMHISGNVMLIIQFT